MIIILHSIIALQMSLTIKKSVKGYRWAQQNFRLRNGIHVDSVTCRLIKELYKKQFRRPCAGNTKWHGVKTTRHNTRMNNAVSTIIRHCPELAARETDTEPKSQKAQRSGLTQICAKETGVHSWSRRCWILLRTLKATSIWGTNMRHLQNELKPLHCGSDINNYVIINIIIISAFFFSSDNVCALTFRNRASCIQDRRFATFQRTLFIYLINKYITLSDICLTVHHWYK